MFVAIWKNTFVAIWKNTKKRNTKLKIRKVNEISGT